MHGYTTAHALPLPLQAQLNPQVSHAKRMSRGVRGMSRGTPEVDLDLGCVSLSLRHPN